MTAGKESGTLYVVATPIGNLGDMSYRAVQQLEAADLILAEDTRHTRRLLDQFGLDRPLRSLHEHNERKQVDAVVGWLLEGQSIALVSDAGTPLISDPGYVLVRAARAEGISVTGAPGPCAAVMALSISGLATDSFVFEGFLPARQQARQKHLQGLVSESRTLVFYESSHRIVESLNAMVEVLGEDRPTVVARELTKAFETVYTGTLARVAAEVDEDPNGCRGEFVVVVEGRPGNEVPEDTVSVDVMVLLERLLSELPVKRAARVVADLTGHSRNELYRKALDLRGDGA